MKEKIKEFPRTVYLFVTFFGLVLLMHIYAKQKELLI